MKRTVLRKQSGFTFIEILLVIVLLGLLVTLTIPTIGAFLVPDRTAEYRHLLRVIRSLRNNAILGQNVYYIVFNFEDQLFQVERVMKEGGRNVLDHPKILKPHTFPDDFRLVNVYLTAEEPSVFSQDTSILDNDIKFKPPIEIIIDSSGFVTPFTLIFEEDDKRWKIVTQGVMGKLNLEEITNVFL